MHRLCYLWTLRCWGWCASSSDTRRSSLGSEWPPLEAGRRRSPRSVAEDGHENGIKCVSVQVGFFFFVCVCQNATSVLSPCGVITPPGDRLTLSFVPAEGLSLAAALIRIFALFRVAKFQEFSKLKTFHGNALVSDTMVGWLLIGTKESLESENKNVL